MIRVLLVDGHQMFREGVCSCLANAPDICVVGQAGTASEAVALIASTNPTVVVFDVRLPDAAGVDFARHVRSEWPTIKLVTLTGLRLHGVRTSHAARRGGRLHLEECIPQLPC